MNLEEIKGLGPASIKKLNKIGITNSYDLISYFPFRYDIIERTKENEIIDEARIIMDGIVETVPSVFHFNNKMDKMSFKLNSGNRLFNVVIYNRGFLKSKLTSTTPITVIGKYDFKHNTIIASDLRFSLLNEKVKLEPVYHTTYGMSGKQISSYINTCLKEQVKVTNYIPDYLTQKYQFLDKEKCIYIVHNPIDLNVLKAATNCLKYEELFLFMLKMNYLKRNKKKQIGLKRKIEYKKVLDFIETLPFKLTPDQEKSIEDIYEDLIGGKRMNRLLQGDVGSGKTIVAIISMYINHLSGYQSALMAPTEILATQHYQNIVKIFEPFNIKVALLTGKLKAKEKKTINESIKDGEVSVVIGTHALISDMVTYYNLGLVITDEQHRFGVNQRGNLKNKGITPDILYMSATPIPRTYALTLYGDMDISNIKSRPFGRKDVITTLRKEKDMKEVLEDMFVELKKGHQIYVVAPLIEESDKIDLENVYNLQEKMTKAFGKLFKIGVLHGKVDSKEKEDIMGKFSNNEINILISTTVIEVGLDIKNATMMIIFDAFRFGLSALHQLRGRVGRNDLQSYCILISNHETERLKILTQTNDGFKISEEDFLLRGSGDLFGFKQSGDMAFSIADVKKDYNILIKAKEDSLEFLEKGLYDYTKYAFIKNLVERVTNLD